jgi:predicted pyridoxine 5'-phosphate oxidase superfamily flavin-nucleotide-binding protein
VKKEFKVRVITQEIKEFVNKQKLGFVATVCPDGTPNLSPKGTTIAWDDECIVFADIHSPGSINNLLINPSVEINVVDIFTRKGYRFKGKAEVLSEGKIFDKIITHYRSRGSKHTIKNIALIKVDRVLPILSPAYDTDLSEDEITERWIDYWHTIHPKNKP